MRREDIFEAARVAEFTRVSECCPGVELKLCSNDQWKGDLGAFVTQIETRVVQRCIDFINNGSFLSDDSPPKRFANEVTAEMKRRLMPMLELTPEVLREMMRPMDAFETHSSHRNRFQMFSSLDKPDNPLSNESKPKNVGISYAQALELFRTHLTSHFLKAGWSHGAIAELLIVEVQTPTQDVRALVERLIQEGNERGAIRESRGPESEYSWWRDKEVKVYITDTPEVGEDGIKKED